MLSLAGYASSDEESDDETQDQLKSVDICKSQPNPVVSKPHADKSPPDQASKDQASSDIGPSVGPTLPAEPNVEEDPTSTTLSPYSSSRTAIRELTMPPVPNLNIPPSPPGSPPYAATKKFANFLELKNQGVHLNAKLGSSSAIRNPGVLSKLLDFAGIDHYDQYASALPEDLATLASYPPWAYGEELNKTQQKLLKRKAEKAKSSGRDKIEFVSANTATRGREGRPPSPKRRRRSRSR